MPSKLRDIKCRCGHDQAQHQPTDPHGFEWCRGDCGCSYFEKLYEPEPTKPTNTPTKSLASWWPFG